MPTRSVHQAPIQTISKTEISTNELPQNEVLSKKEVVVRPGSEKPMIHVAALQLRRAAILGLTAYVKPAEMLENVNAYAMALIGEKHDPEDGPAHRVANDLQIELDRIEDELESSSAQTVSYEKKNN